MTYGRYIRKKPNYKRRKMPAVTHGKRTGAYAKVKNELEPVSDEKVPAGFDKDTWALLPYEDKLDFVKKKKDAVLFALQTRLTSPVVSLMCDLAELETKMEAVSIEDAMADKTLSKDYVTALKLKIELAKALKQLTDKGIVTHKHVVDRLQTGEDAIDVDFEEIFEPVKKDEDT